MDAEISNQLTPLQICGLIQYKTGMTVPVFSRHIGVHKTNVYLAIKGKLPGSRVRGLIADAVGKSPAELWPESQAAA